MKRNSIIFALCSFIFLSGIDALAAEEKKETLKKTLKEHRIAGYAAIKKKMPWYPNTTEENFEIIPEESEQKQWEYAMPLMAQKVIDMGFDLPLPYGTAVIYTKIQQEITLTDLEVGANGNGLIPTPFVSFSDASALNDTVQVKADMWLFPFMNVFAVMGGIKGDAKLDFTIDGNGVLDQAGIDCTKPINRPLCRKFQDNLVTISLGNGTGDINGESTKYSGYNVGIGTILAAGYKGWFIAIPITYVYSDIDVIDSKVETLSISPRIGKTMDMGDIGTFSVFVGGGYLDVDMDLTGTIYMGMGDLDTIEYKIHQKNTDKWNALAGFNWEVTKHWSVNLEAGFLGSRENIFVGMTYRH